MSSWTNELVRLRNYAPERTGMHDVTGREILTGDIIEFWFGEHVGYSVNREHGQQTRMLDVVERRDEGFYAVNYHVGGGLFLCRLDGSCRWLGTVHENPELLRDGPLSPLK
jgi:hypothetical protein